MVPRINYGSREGDVACSSEHSAPKRILVSNLIGENNVEFISLSHIAQECILSQ